jgi:hypothetical protein
MTESNGLFNSNDDMFAGFNQMSWIYVALYSKISKHQLNKDWNIDKTCLKRSDDFKKCFTDRAVINALDKCLLQNITKYQCIDCSLRVGNQFKLLFNH